MTSCNRTPAQRAGLTLVELLVVISVAVLLMAASVQLLRLPLQSRRTREAARQMSAIVSRAKARAAELQRPVGILIRRGSTDVENGVFYSTQMHLIESPAYYVGEMLYQGNSTAGSAAWVHEITYSPSTQQPVAGKARIVNAAGFNPSAVQRVVRPGDHIRFNYQRPWYKITDIYEDLAPPPSAPLPVYVVEFEDAYDAYCTPPYSPTTPNWLPFQVAGQPGGSRLFPSLNAPLELPNGVGIDLSASGTGLAGLDFQPQSPQDTSDVVIMFSPAGNVDRIYHSTSAGVVGFDATSPVYLLIGKIDQISPADLFAMGQDFKSNLMDGSSIWVAIGNRNSKLTVAENQGLEEQFPIGATAADQAAALATARMYAISGQDMGGQ